MDSLELFSRKIRISKNEIRQALTHYSFYDDKDELKANGRFIFKGMSVFKGQVAEILAKYYNGTGTQLQHILGNLFRIDYLNRLFDEWSLKSHIRCSTAFDINKHKHIFVFAIFGCVSELDSEKRRKFIFKYILNDQNQYVFNHVVRNKDFVHQAKEVSKHTLGQHISTKMQQTDDLLHKAIVVLGDGTVISEASSKSYRYARKKAMKMALGIISNISFEKYISESNYLERIQKRIAEEKEIKQQELQQRLAAKEIRRIAKIEEAKRIKKARDLARKKAQAEAKKHKAERVQLLAEKAVKEQRPMSSKKSRFLEDKKK